MAQDMDRASPRGPARNASVTCQGTEPRSGSTVAWGTDLAERAAELAGQGFPVFPCLPGDKRPAVDRWEQRASADPEHVIEAWRGRYAYHNIGLACRRLLVVLDLDTHGTLPEEWRLPGILDGRDVLAQLCEWARQPWPATRWTSTQRGGWHLWFRAPSGGPELRNTAGLLGPMVDTRASGGYIVVPPSVVDGGPYELLDYRDPEPLPGWLLRLLQPVPAPRRPPVAAAAGPANLRGLVETVSTAQPGDRTGPLVWAAHLLREEIADGRASLADGELLVQAAVAAGINGGERYARGQVKHVLGGA